MGHVQLRIVVARPDDLVGVGRRGVALDEHRTVLRAAVGGIVGQMVDAVAYDRLARLDALAEVHRTLVRLPRPARRGIERVVFAHRPLVEAETRFEREGHVTMDVRRLVAVGSRRRAVGAGVVEICENLAADVFAVVAILEERLLVGRLDRFLVPGHGTEGTHLGVIEQRAEETPHTLVVVQHSFRCVGLAHIVEIEVDRTQLRPVARPPVRRIGGRIVVLEIGRRTVPCVCIGVLVAVDEVLDARGETPRQTVGIDFQRRFVFEVVFALDLVGVLLCQEILARAEQNACEQDCNVFFHNALPP